MKKKLFIFILFIICNLFNVTDMIGQTAQVINTTGGTGLTDGLKIQVNTNGQLAVYRDNQAQYCCGNMWPNGAGGGVNLTFRFDNGTAYNTTTRSLTACATTSVQQVGNTYTTSIAGWVQSPIQDNNVFPIFYVTINVTYIHPNNYFLVDYFVRAPENLQTPQTVHLYLDHDSYILGKDGSRGYQTTNGTGHFVGDYRLESDNSGCGGSANRPQYPSTHGFKTKNGFRSYYSGSYSSRNGINATTLMLANLVTNNCVDDGIAVEFTIGPLAAGQTKAKQVLHGYGNAQGEFDNTPVSDPAVSSAPSSAVTVNLKSATFSGPEGDSDHPANTVKIVVSGGALAQSQVCNFTLSNVSAIQNTDYSYVKGFTIPAGDYTTPRELILDNITIKGNTVCQADRTFKISIDLPGNCNDLIKRGEDINTAVFTIEDDEPRPVISTNLPNLTYHHGQTVPAIALASSPGGATITWTNNNTSIGLGAGGTGNIPSFTATNTSASVITATITVTPTLSCTGTPKTYTITVNPKFTIAYHYNGGTAPITSNPLNYTYGSSFAIPNEPTRTGYTFGGWTCAELGITTPTKPVTVPANTESNLNLYADWGSGPDSYTLTYILGGGTIPPPNPNPATYDVLTPAFTLKNPVKPGYTFTGWTGTGLGSPTMVVSVLTGSITNRTYTATWSAPITYNVTYNFAGGLAPATANKATYTITDVPFAITTTAAANQPTRTGYTFTGWVGQDIVTATKTIHVNTNSFSTPGQPEHLAYTAQWSTVLYTIAYDLKGGTVSTPNHTSFDITTSAFTLNNPTRPGYTFTGWTGTGLGGATATVSIASGSIGDRSYVANWTPINYAIKYVDSDGTTVIAAPGAPTQYNDSELPKSFASTPVKPGYTFVNWAGTGASGASATIPSGTLGALTYQAVWTANAYTITFNANGGVNPAIPANWQGYTMILLPINSISVVPTRSGYTFNGWTGHGQTNQKNPFTVTNGTSGVPGNLTYTAQWNLNTYNIAYTLNSGTVGTPNPVSYNVNTTTFTLNNPTRSGYTFAGWTGSNGTTPQITVSIPAGTTGNLNYEANWTTDAYTISYNHDGGVAPVTPNPSAYNVTTPAFTLNNPTRPGYTFAGWTGTGLGSATMTVTVPLGSTGNRSYLAKWNPINYAIKYVDSDGSTVIAAPGAPAQYNDTELPKSFTSTPTKSGFTFVGWTGTGATGASVTIPAGTLGAITYQAIWSANAYTIAFDANGGTNPAIPTNWQGYDVTDLPINGVSVTPTRLGYTFKGWDGHGLTAQTTPFNITTSTIGAPGNLNFIAGWQLNNYSITYDPNGGLLVAGNPASYDVTQLPVSIAQDPTHLNPKNVFIGWTCQQLPGVPMQLAFNVPANTTGNLDIKANWTAGLNNLNPSGINDTIIFCDGPKTLYGDPQGKAWEWIFPDGSQSASKNISTSQSGRYICRTDYGTVTVADTLYAYFFSGDNTKIKYLTTTGAKIGKPQQFVVEISSALLPNATSSWNTGGGTVINATTDTLTVVWNSTGDKTVSVRLEFNYGGVVCSKTYTSTIRISQQQRGFFVNQNAGGGDNDGSSWGNAYRTIQDALVHATAGDCIWVAKGVYNAGQGKSFVMAQDSVAIYGGFSGTEANLYERNFFANPTVMAGSNTHPVAIVGGADVRLDGFTIRNGRSVNGAGILFENGASGTVANCVIKKNSATARGGGIYANAPWYGYRPSLFINTEISGNQALEGAGVYNNGSDLQMLNLTISGNKGETTGGFSNNGGNPDIRNTIIWGNLTTKGNESNKNVSNNGGNPVYSYSVVGGSKGSGSSWVSALGRDGSHNKDVGPLFLRTGYESDGVTMREGDYHLSMSSPVVNQGRNAYVLQGVYMPWNIQLENPKRSFMEGLPIDLDYAERIAYDIVDMGAYEAGSKSLGISPITRGITIPQIEGASTNPGAGIHYVKSMGNFEFTITPGSGYAGQRPVVTTSRTTIPDSQGVLVEKNADGSFKVTIYHIQEWIDVFIDFTTGNASVSEAAIWTYNDELHVKTIKEASVLNIYNIAGQLYKQQQLPEGETILTLPQGVYIVTLDNGGKQKVVIR